MTIIICLAGFHDLFAVDSGNSSNHECVILLHGLARTKSSMEDLEESLTNDGYKVVNIDYPSREYRIEDLAEKYIPEGIQACESNSQGKIHFVTHSMGGILVRYYLSKFNIPNLGRVVMLSPPNKGSEVVDTLKDTPGFYALNGPAGMQLGTDENSLPNQLGPVQFELGVITGNASVNLILSQMIPGEDDGKVSVKRAKVEGMTDFYVVDHSHPLIMTFEDVIDQVKYFLKEGKFNKTLP